jgi:proteasome lid subunit RPN8/RPN11
MRQAVVAFRLRYSERRRLHDRAYRAQQAGHHEVAGALVADRRMRLTLVFLPNGSKRPYYFEIRGSDLSALRKRLVGTGRKVVGAFHSHPVGLARLSPGDISGVPVRSLELVYDVCGRTATLWRVVGSQRKKAAREVPLVLEPRGRPTKG